ncbi:unnamed protein product [Musa hybrid cultivar]
MARRCSHCNHNGHNSRTCPNRGVKLFGVHLTDGSVRKSASMGNLSLLAGSSGGASPADGPEPGSGAAGGGYASEDFVKGSSSSCRERKKGEPPLIFHTFCLPFFIGLVKDVSFIRIDIFSSINFFIAFQRLLLQIEIDHMDFLLLIFAGTPWTEEEHRMFLLGLQKLGKGDWRGISRTYVASRTPTQVASHAQKYFIRKTNMTRRKRRSSLFDMVPDEVSLSLSLSLSLSPLSRCLHNMCVWLTFLLILCYHLEFQEFPMSFQESEAQNNNLPPVPPTLNEECESMDSNDATIGEAVVPQPEAPQCSYPVILPAYFSPLLQFPFPCWPGYKADTSEQQAHEIIKPTAVHSKTPMNIDELVGMSKLSIGESRGSTLDLLGRSKRQSAFHASPSTKAQA